MLPIGQESIIPQFGRYLDIRRTPPFVHGYHDLRDSYSVLVPLLLLLLSPIHVIRRPSRFTGSACSVILISLVARPALSSEDPGRP